jgi:hypothetical protein
MTGATNSILKSVTTISSDNAWVVGFATLAVSARALTMHWDGRRWTVAPGNTPDGDAELLGVLAKVLPSPDSPSGYLNLLWSASATSRGNIWAVGTTHYASTLIVHWNGAAWS